MGRTAVNHPYAGARCCCPYVADERSAAEDAVLLGDQHAALTPRQPGEGGGDGLDGVVDR
ncbi:hypothetical protein ADL03_01005 [Nocardia sp. NRRL S-836]|nr:hypothetical protein ADL03_01005 [Nocardia sp. NRRL S-836]